MDNTNYYLHVCTLNEIWTIYKSCRGNDNSSFLETHVQSFHVDSENLNKDLKLSTEATGAKRLTTSVESCQIS